LYFDIIALFVVSGFVRIWCHWGPKLGENNLRVTEKYYVIPPCSSYGADVPEYTKYTTLGFYWIDNCIESNIKGLCASEVT